MKSFDDIIAKYGLIVVMMVVVGIIGLVLYFWKKDDETKNGKTIGTAGLGAAIVGLIVGLAAIAYTAFKTPKTTTNNNNDSGGEDSFPED